MIQEREIERVPTNIYIYIYMYVKQKDTRLMGDSVLIILSHLVHYW